MRGSICREAPFSGMVDTFLRIMDLVQGGSEDKQRTYHFELAGLVGELKILERKAWCSLGKYASVTAVCDKKRLN